MPKVIKNGMVTTYEYKPINPVPKKGGLGLGCYIPLIVAGWLVVQGILSLLGVI